MRALYQLVGTQQWQVVITHIHSLAEGDAVEQLFYQYHGYLYTAIMWACIRSAPLELVQLMITKAKLDSKKRCLLAVTATLGGRPFIALLSATPPLSSSS